MNRKTKIIATVGPSVDSKVKIFELIDSGADVIRVNFSHGSYEDHKNIVDWVRDYPKSIAIMQDIQGPKIRTGIAQDGTFLNAGEVVELTSNESTSDDKSLYINYQNLFTDIKPGERVFIDDGQVVMRVLDFADNKMKANIEIGGELRDNQGVAFPDSKLSVSAITLKDKKDLAYGEKIGVDIVAVSFVRKASDITEVKSLIKSNIKIIAKIELKEAMKNLDSIIDESDGVMVARGDLGVQLPLEQVPFAQKKILDTANYKGKISITATEMLQSMKTSFRPTRAEVTDITNAILDGTDAVMLSAETSIGEHPNIAVKVMASICEEADSNSHYSSMRFKTLSSVDTFATSLAKAAVQVANDIDAKAIVAYTETGRTPLLISNFRPSAPIITFSAKDLTLRQMNILWGVEQTKIDRFDTTEEMFQLADSWLQTHKKFKKNDKVVIVAGTPPNQEAATNLLRVMKIGE
ncbi:pyruvate kinase [Candidatus Actinomarina sp.]|nr:pyruvate kinase [Candidatus Actinomarina sp.]MDA9173213.1 pyruvate kinase [Acidimicrobiia bacterium]